MILIADLSEAQEVLLNILCEGTVAEDAPNTNYVILEEYVELVREQLNAWGVKFELVDEERVEKSIVTVWTYDCLTEQEESILRTICEGDLTFVEGAECGGYTFPARFKKQIESQMDTWMYEYHS